MTLRALIFIGWALAGAPAAFAQAGPPTAGLQAAIVAGGCFWCVEADFDTVDGVVETLSGYTGGDVGNPSYSDVVGGGTGHREAVRILFDPQKIDYATLVAAFLRTIDPLDGGGQFCDRGFAYSTAIYVDGADQRAAATAAIAQAQDVLGAEIATVVEDAGAFWPAENYHQDYHVNNPIRYNWYRAGCGRDRRVRALWGADGKEALTALGAS